QLQVEWCRPIESELSGDDDVETRVSSSHVRQAVPTLAIGHAERERVRRVVPDTVVLAEAVRRAPDEVLEARRHVGCRRGGVSGPIEIEQRTRLADAREVQEIAILLVRRDGDGRVELRDRDLE